MCFERGGAWRRGVFLLPRLPHGVRAVPPPLVPHSDRPPAEIGHLFLVGFGGKDTFWFDGPDFSSIINQFIFQVIVSIFEE